MGYTVVLEQESDGGYVVSVPALPGCVSQGDTREEALENVREAIAIYIEHLKVHGKPVPRKRELPVWPGVVIGALTQEEVYDDIA